MREYQSLSHVRWECKRHIVFAPKYRKKVLWGRTRRGLEESFTSSVGKRKSGWLLGMHCLIMFICC